MRNLLRKYYYAHTPIRNLWFENILYNPDDLRLLSLQQKVKPDIALIEVTKSCNLSCVYCPNKLAKNNNLFMDYQVYMSIIDQLPSGIELQPVGLGESCLHPEFLKMIEYASSRKKFRLIAMATNLTAKDSDFYLKLFEKGLDFLSVSIDTFNPETINLTRRGTDIHLLTSNLKILAKQFPDTISAHVTLSGNNIGDLKDTIEKLIEFGVKRMTIKDVITFTCLPNSGLSRVKNEKLAGIIQSFSGQIDIQVVELENCTRLFTEIAVNVEGNLLFCHYGFMTDDSGWGKIENDLMKKYYSREFARLRSSFYKKVPALCTSCPYYPVL